MSASKQSSKPGTRRRSVSKARTAEETRRASEQRFRAMIEKGLDAIALVSSDGVLTYTSPAVTRILGYDPDQLTGRSVYDLIHPDDVQRLGGEFNQLAEEPGASITVQFRAGHSNGSWRWIEGVGTNLLTDPTVQAIVGNFRDVTEAREAAEDLRYVTSHARCLLWHAVVRAHGPESDRVYDWNFQVFDEDAAHQFLPLSVKQGENYADVWYSSKLPEDRASMDRNAIAALEGGRQGYSQEFRCRRKDGAIRWISEQTYIEPIGAGVWRLAGVCTDITGRKRAAEETLRRLSFLAETSEILGSSLDYISNLERLTSRLVPELADWCFADLVIDSETFQRVAIAHADPDPSHLGQRLRRTYRLRSDPSAGIARALMYQEKQCIEAVGAQHLDSIALDEEHLDCLRSMGICCYHSYPLIARGRTLGALTFALTRPDRRFSPEDRSLAEEIARRTSTAIDNARLYQEAREADQRKDEFLAMLAHELRNPLMAISNAVGITRSEGATDEMRRRARTVVERQVQHMARQVEDLLNTSRITHGKMTLYPERLDFCEAVRSAVEDHRTPLEAGGISVALEIDSGPIWVDADPIRLTQILGNLLDNARKFSNDGGMVLVKVQRDIGMDCAVASVRDSGIGIPADVIANLFEPFVQEDRSLDRDRGGLGLGLALVRGLVELHGGEVSALSEGPGLGSEFTLRFPLASGPGAVREAATFTPAKLPARRILVVEDNHDAAETLHDLLELMGFEVDLAFSGPAGIDAARRFRPDVVLCDIGLPGMDGYEVAATLRRDSATAAAWLLAITGYGQADDYRRAIDAGFNDHLTKPVDPANLLRILSSVSRISSN